MSVRGTLRMVCRVFDALYCCTFEWLVGICQFFDTLLICIRYFGQPLRTSGLSRTARTDLRGIVAEFVELGLFIASELRISLERCVAGFSVVGHVGVLY